MIPILLHASISAAAAVDVSISTQQAESIDWRRSVAIHHVLYIVIHVQCVGKGEAGVAAAGAQVITKEKVEAARKRN